MDEKTSAMNIAIRGLTTTMYKKFLQINNRSSLQTNQLILQLWKISIFVSILQKEYLPSESYSSSCCNFQIQNSKTDLNSIRTIKEYIKTNVF